MTAARTIVSGSTRFLRSKRILRQDHTTISPPFPFRCNHSSPPSGIQEKWSPPEIIVGIPEDAFCLDIGRWLVRLHEPRTPRKLSDPEAFALSAKVLANAVEGGLEEAKRKIYVISADPKCLGFGACINKEIVKKLSRVKCVKSLHPDYYREARDNDPEARKLRVNVSSSD